MAEDPLATIQVELIYAEADEAHRFVLTVCAGSTVGDAIAACPGLASIVALQGRALEVGIFGHRCEPGQRLQAGDRIEIYRSLQVDPKLARRRRAAGSADQAP